MRFASVLVLAAAPALAMVACSTISGLGDLSFDLGTGGASHSSASSSGTGGHGGTGGMGTAGMGGGKGEGGGGASSSSTGGVTEDCTNGKDDDGNNLIDCADPHCKLIGATCGSAPGGSWSGPVWIAIVPMGSAPPCPDASKPIFTGFQGLIQDPATCDACMCGAASCSMKSVNFYSDALCTALLGSVAQTAAMCKAVPGYAALSVKAAAPTASCTPSGGTAHTGAVKWTSDVVACGIQTGGGCMNNEVCYAPDPNFAKVCVYRQGNAPCPMGFPKKDTIATSYDDSRGCSSCNCDAAPVTCDGSTDLFQTGTCQAGAATFANNGTCSAQAGGTVNSLKGSAPPLGSCNPSGGNPNGSIAEANTFEICCTN